MFSAGGAVKTKYGSMEEVDSFLNSLDTQLPDRAAMIYMAMANINIKTNPMYSPLVMWNIPFMSGQVRVTLSKINMETC